MFYPVDVQFQIGQLSKSESRIRLHGIFF
jgi:hypothetical protein